MEVCSGSLLWSGIGNFLAVEYCCPNPQEFWSQISPSGGIALIGMVGMGTLESGISEKGHSVISTEGLKTQVFIRQLRHVWLLGISNSRTYHIDKNRIGTLYRQPGGQVYSLWKFFFYGHTSWHDPRYGTLFQVPHTLKAPCFYVLMFTLLMGNISLKKR